MKKKMGKYGFHIKIGNLHGFFYGDSGRPILTIGPHCNFHTGPFFVCLLIVTTTVGVLLAQCVIPNGPLIVSYIGAAICLLFLVSYSVTTLKDPGIRYRADGLTSELIEAAQCQVCLVNQPLGVFHCSDCNLCIEKFDHHCPWITKCIGKGNRWWFYIFVGSTVVMVVYFMLTFTLTMGLK